MSDNPVKIIIAVILAVILLAGGLLYWRFGGLSGRSDLPSASLEQKVSASPEGGEEIVLDEEPAIPLLWADNNENENLIIKSDRQYYDATADGTEVYFSVANQTANNQQADIYFWFDGSDKRVASVEKIADGKIINSQFSIFNEFSMPKFSNRKDVNGYTAGSKFSDAFLAGQTNYYKAVIKTSAPINSQPSEFFIEAFAAPSKALVEKGKFSAYGHLDPYLAGGLTSYWSFDGATMDWGNDPNPLARDSSGNNNDVSLLNMSRSSSPIIGINGQALKFVSAKSQRGSVDGNWSTMMSASEGTVSAWFYATAEGVGACSNGSASGIVGDTDGWVWIGLQGTNLCVGDGNGNTTVNTSISLNKWYHAVWVHAGGTLYMYLNGAYVGQTTGGNIDASQSVWIGYSFGNYFDGYIDEVRVYSRGLSAAEIAELYKLGAVRAKTNSPISGRGIDSSLIGYWSFDGPDMVGTSTAIDRAPSYVISDNFNRANGDLDGSTSSDGKFTWGEAAGTALAIDTGTVYVAGNQGFNVGVALDGGTFQLPTANDYVQFKLADWVHGGGGQSAEAWLRIGEDEGSAYVLKIAEDVGGQRWEFADGNDHLLDSGALTISDNDIFRLEVEGTTFRIKQNGITLHEVVDTQYDGTSGTAVGLAVYSDNAGSVTRIDDFEAGTLGNDGTVYLSKPAPGINGQGLNVDYWNGGTVDLGVIGQSGALTICLWTKLNQYPADDVILSNHSPTRLQYSVEVNPSGSLLHYWDPGGGSSMFQTVNGLISLGSWYSICLARVDTDTVYFYVNGVQYSTNETGSAVVPTVDFGHTMAKAPGYLDDIRIYNRALSQAEITNIYKAGASQMTVNAPPAQLANTGSSLKGYWTFDGQDITGTSTALDRSKSNGNFTASFPATPVLDSFTRSNEGPPMTGWTDMSNGLKVVSYAAAGNVDTDTGVNISYYNASVYGPDSEAFVTITTNNSSDVAVSARTTDISGASYDGYVVYMSDVSAGTDDILIFRVDDGTPTLLGDAIPQEFSNGDSFGIRVVGNSISAFYKPSGGSWTLMGTRTDGTYTGAGYIALGEAHDAGDSPGAILDDFGGGSIGNNGTIFGAKPAIGISGQALSFDGSNDYVSLSDTPFDFGNGQTISLAFWTKVNRLRTYDTWIAKGSARWGMQMDSVGKIAFWFYYGSFDGCLSNSPQISIGSWYHISFTYTFGTGSSAKMYVNGQPVPCTWDTNGGNGVLTTDDNPLIFGDSSIGGGENFSGLLDDVRVYNRALTASEVLQLYNLGARKAKIRQ